MNESNKSKEMKIDVNWSIGFNEIRS